MNDWPESWSPEYNKPIRVIDSLVRTLPIRRRAHWRQLRDAALALWSVPTGLGFEVTRGVGISWRGGYKNPAWPSYYTADAITIVRLEPTEEYPQTCWAPHLREDAGLVGLTLNFPAWWADYYFRTARSIICHELGHALGLGHGGDGVMMGRRVPNAEELQIVRDYYYGDSS